MHAFPPPSMAGGISGMTECYGGIPDFKILHILQNSSYFTLDPLILLAHFIWSYSFVVI